VPCLIIETLFWSESFFVLFYWSYRLLKGILSGGFTYCVTDGGYSKRIGRIGFGLIIDGIYLNLELEKLSSKEVIFLGLNKVCLCLL